MLIYYVNMPLTLLNMRLNGYLCYKTITSQNVPSDAQVIFFLFHIKVIFCSRDIQVFEFLTISWFAKSVTSWWWWVLVQEAMCIFATTTTQQTCPIDRYKQGQHFSEIFWTILRTEAKFKVLFSLATCSN